MVEDPNWRALEKALEQFDLAVAAAQKTLNELKARASTVAPRERQVEILVPEPEAEPLKKAS